MSKNPIIEQLVNHLESGKDVGLIHPESTMQPNKKVTFHFGDGTTEVFQTEGDHKTFMKWWRGLATFIQRSRKIKDVEGFEA